MKKIFLLSLTALLLVACQNTSQLEETIDTPTEETSNQEQIMTDKELVIETLSEGNGETAKSGDFLVMHYTGTLTDGKKFDSSVDRNEPFRFTLGVGQVIEGWDKGVEGMKVGEKRKLTVPYHMAYGEAGFPPVIPPKSTLVFEIELLEIANPTWKK